jgi:hypothetical protein
LSGELGGVALGGHAFTNQNGKFFAIECAVGVAIESLDHGLEWFGEFVPGEFAVAVAIHAAEAFEHGLRVALRCWGAWSTLGSLTGEIGAEFGGVEATVAIAVERFEGGYGQVDFFFGELSVAVFVECVQEWVWKSACEATGPTEATGAWWHEHSGATAFRTRAFRWPFITLAAFAILRTFAVPGTCAFRTPITFWWAATFVGCLSNCGGDYGE